MGRSPVLWTYAPRSGCEIVTALLLAVPFGVAIGLAVGMVGGGGAVLAVPVLIYVVGLDIHEATTVSLAVVAYDAGGSTAVSMSRSLT